MLSTAANAFANGAKNANLLVCQLPSAGLNTIPLVALQLARIGVANGFCATAPVPVTQASFVYPCAPPQPVNQQQLQLAATAGAKATATCTNLGNAVTPTVQVSVANPGVVIDTTAATVTATLTMTNNGPTNLAR